MRIEHTSVRGRMARTMRLLAAGLCLVFAFAYAPVAGAAAASQHFGASELAAISSAVDRSGVGGIAWHVDAASDRVVVTAFDAGNYDEALAKLHEARKAGWWTTVYQRDLDPNLASIRDDPEFKAVFADMARDMAQQRARLAARPKDAPLDLTQAAR